MDIEAQADQVLNEFTAFAENSAAAPVAAAEDSAIAHTEVAEQAAADDVVTDEATQDAQDAPDAEAVADEAAADDSETDTDTKAVANDDEDNFDSLLGNIPTNEQLLAKHNRIPQTAKDEITHLADNWRSSQESLNAIGGKDGVELLKPVAALMANPNPTEKEAFQVMTSLMSTNLQAGLLGVVTVADEMLNSPNPVYKGVGDALIGKTFGKGVTADHIRNLLAIEEAGYVNVEEDLKLISQNGDAATVYKSQTNRIADLEKQLAEQAALLQDPEKLIAQMNNGKAVSFEADFDAKVVDAVAPFLEQGKWGKDSKLAAHVLPGIVATLKNDKDYKSVVAFVAQSGYQSQNVPYPVQQSLNSLINKAKARTIAAIKDINGELKARPSINAAVKEKVAQTKPQAKPLAASAPNGGYIAPGRSGSADEKANELLRQLDAQIGA